MCIWSLSSSQICTKTLTLQGKQIEMMRPLTPGVMALLSLLLVAISCFRSASAYGNAGFDPLANLMTSRTREVVTAPAEFSPVNLAAADQTGLMEADKIEKLPGQPDGVDFDQYSGYVTVDADAGRALFYYFTEAPKDAASKPLVLWLNGGPGCSSFGNGAMMELGPFRVNADGKTLWRNEFAWNNVANVLFLESPAGVGFSYSNRSSDYTLSGDERSAQDSYIFLLNWLQRFPQYKNRDFYIAGESYAGHYVPQLAHKILINNNNNDTTTINLRGIAIGNAWIDDRTNSRGMYDYFWTHALISDQLYEDIRKNCTFYGNDAVASLTLDTCDGKFNEVLYHMGKLFIYDIYAPLCKSSGRGTTRSMGGFDPCSDDYISTYLNFVEVQKALHVSPAPYAWQSCNLSLGLMWNDSPTTILPTIQLLMEKNLSVWIYSGDTDGRVPVTSSKYSVDTFNLSISTPWYPWYTDGEVGGYAVGYGKNLALVTVRGAGHFVPSYQPARALALFTSFLQGKLPPTIS